MSGVYNSKSPCQKCGSFKRYRSNKKCASCKAIANAKLYAMEKLPKGKLRDERVVMAGVHCPDETGYLA